MGREETGTTCLGIDSNDVSESLMQACLHVAYCVWSHVIGYDTCLLCQQRLASTSFRFLAVEKGLLSKGWTRPRKDRNDILQGRCITGGVLEIGFLFLSW